jgi:cell division protein FtsI (penicillin-binding protein 3)
MMHQRLMFGLLVYAGVVALIVLRSSISRPSAIMRAQARPDGAGPERGDIVDRDGQPLARTIDAWTIGLWPKKVIGDKLDLARKLARAHAGDRTRRLFRDAPSDKSFYYLRRRAAPGLVEAVNAIGEPGIALEREPDRLYPQTSLAAHVIGYHDDRRQGVAGIERALRQAFRRATRGQPLQLSISSKVQQALEHELLAR